MKKITRLASLVYRAARKFKEYSIEIKRPLLINIVQATALRSSDLDGNSDPYTIISVFPNRETVSQYSVAKYNTSTSVKHSTLNPIWNETMLIPCVTGHTKIVFTVVDFDLLSRNDFLGQATISLKDFSYPLRYQNLDISLGSLKVSPRDKDLTPISMGDSEMQGQGILKVEIIPCCNTTSMAGYLKFSTSQRDSGNILFFEQDNHSRKWVVLTGAVLNIYDPNKKDISYERSTDVQLITSIIDYPSEFHVISNGKIWIFACDPLLGSTIDRYKQRRLWLEKISLAADIPIISSSSSIEARNQERIQVQKIGSEILAESKIARKVNAEKQGRKARSN